MTQWGMLLLCAYIMLGVSGRVSLRKAGRIGLLLTGIVMTVVVIGYSSKTPKDKYIRSIDATVYATGNTYPVGWGNGTTATQSTEDTTGIKAASWETTDGSSSATSDSNSSTSSRGGP